MGDNRVMTDAAASPLATTLGLAPGDRIGVINPPPQLESWLDPMPRGATLEPGVRSHRDVVLAFLRLRTELGQKRIAMAKAIEPDGVLWVAWPAGPGAEATDLDEGAVRELAAPSGLVATQVCALGEGWSAARLVLAPAAPGSSNAF